MRLNAFAAGFAGVVIAWHAAAQGRPIEAAIFAAAVLIICALPRSEPAPQEGA